MKPQVLLHPCVNEDPGSAHSDGVPITIPVCVPHLSRLLPADVRVVAGFDAEEDGALPYESS